MKQKKLRGYVLPTIYVIILILVFGAVSLITSLFNSKPNYLYSTSIKGEDAIPVVELPGNELKVIIKPFINENVVVDKYFYDINSSEEMQQNSLIYFQNTYMKNTGVLYKSDVVFDCIMVLDGTILDVREDDILGNVVTVEHNNNLRTVYYSLGDVKVKKGDTLSQGEIIGTSGANNLTENKHNLLFEVYYNGALINPEDFYTMDINNME